MNSPVRIANQFAIRFQNGEEILLENSVTNQGLTDILDKYFRTGVSSPAFFFGLVDNSGFVAAAATDTAASHSGWSENTAYNAETRPAWSEGTAANNSITSTTVATFVMSAAATIKGVGVFSDSQKGGTAGILWCTALFATARAFASGESWEIVSYTVNASG